MVVDDSAVVRGLITRTLQSDSRLELVASCSNGEMAIAQAARKTPDVIVLDIEMPVMDGLAALPGILAASPTTRVIMASTLTQRNAAVSLRALSLGAADYIAKPTSDKLGANEIFHRELIDKTVALGRARPIAPPARVVPFPAQSSPTPSSPARFSPDPTSRAQSSQSPAFPVRISTGRRPRIIAIGSSTGGPQALLTLLGNLSPTVQCPIVIAQHMPATFTTVLAQHIARASGRPCVEASDGMELRPGEILLAPGDYHLTIAREKDRIVARLSQTAPENFCRPSVDPLFRSVAQLYGADACAVVLTGMGSDGCKGARVIATAGAPVIAQDEATSVVWGMPGAVANAGICSAVLPLPMIAGHLAGLFQGAAA
jgi:two-component system chemotaxis response regulator CheB